MSESLERENRRRAWEREKVERERLKTEEKEARKSVTADEAHERRRLEIMEQLQQADDREEAERLHAELCAHLEKKAAVTEQAPIATVTDLNAWKKAKGIGGDVVETTGVGVGALLKKVKHGLSSIFTKIEAAGAGRLAKVGPPFSVIKYIPILGPWLFNKPEKTAAEREDEDKKKREAEEKKRKDAAAKAKKEKKQEEALEKIGLSKEEAKVVRGVTTAEEEEGGKKTEEKKVEPQADVKKAA